MKLANIRHSFQAVFLTASLASTVMAETAEGCSLAYRQNIAAAVSCGSRDAVTRCLSDLAEDQGLLQNCLVSAGCTLQDAKRDATWAANSCKMNSDSEESNLELRRLHGLHGLRTIREVVEIRAAAGDDDKTTLSTSKTSDITAAASTTNSWVMVNHVKGTTYTTVTCMTPTTVATSACSFINDADDTQCVATTAVIPTCLPGLMCSFSQTNGAVRCATRGGMDTGGFIVAGVLGVAVALSVATVCFMCCRERRAHKRDRRAAEAQAALAAVDEAKKASRAGTGMAGGDYVPLMGAGGSGPGRGRPGQADPFNEGQQYYDSR
ncbi:hypothetical protein N8I77_000996 [Diaporthe amygdali]|uniref:Uncharacterized protein n=1 Tax=Phomopsis amygdali TaxID=1214568 RepID=A0AAD9SQW0_PHOAM|nr:hypothetical protein N8I77_000996 [Diaporthe amygdali]